MSNDKLFKCGYCGWLINSKCEDLAEHVCFKEKPVGIGTFQFSSNENNVLTIEKIPMENNETWQESAELEEKTSFEELLISAVSARRPLWDHRLNIKERSPLKLKDLWNEIFLILEEKHSVEYIKKRWRQLRDDFTRNKKKQNKYVASGSGADDVPKKPSFKFYQLMMFLDDVDDNIKSQSNVPEQKDIEVLESSELMSPTETFDTMSSSASTSSFVPPETSLETPSKKRKRESNIQNLELHEAILQTLGQQSRPQDAVDGFCLMIGEGLRRLPYRKRSAVQIKILHLLEEAEDEV